MKRKKELCALSFLCGLMFTVSCGSPPKEGVEIVVYKQSSNELSQAHFIEEIHWICLESAKDVLIGGAPELRVTDSNLFVVDQRGSKKVFRFDRSGKFLNTIGSVGRGPGEYVDIEDVVVSGNGNIEIFSSPYVTRHLFTQDGLFLNAKEYPYHASKVIEKEGIYWFYAGYGRDRKERLIQVDASGLELGSFLPTEARVLHFGEQWSVFSKNSGRIFMREGLSLQYVYELFDRSVQPVYRFDFGTLNVTNEYFEHGDPFAAIEKLTSRPFISINAFMESDKYAVVQGIVVEETKEQRYIIGIKEKVTGIWHWFDSPQEGKNALFFGAYLTLTDQSELYCVIESERVVSLSATLQDLLLDNEALKNVRYGDNPVILVLQLKR